MAEEWEGMYDGVLSEEEIKANRELDQKRQEKIDQMYKLAAELEKLYTIVPTNVEAVVKATRSLKLNPLNV